jgi:excisionase family DNA binding protein
MELRSMPVVIPEVTKPTEADTTLAKKSLRQLSDITAVQASDLKIQIAGENQSSEDVALPLSVLRLLKEILSEMAQGRSVALVPLQAELSSQQAADLLNVSRPYLIGLLEAGKIPFRLVGQHRRVCLDDLLAYKQKDEDARRRIADELAADAQELGMGY